MQQSNLLRNNSWLLITIQLEQIIDECEAIQKAQPNAHDERQPGLAFEKAAGICWFLLLIIGWHSAEQSHRILELYSEHRRFFLPFLELRAIQWLAAVCWGFILLFWV